MRNDLLDGPCKKVTVIFGRGANQPGNVGYLVGPAFFNAVSAMMGSENLAVQGVDYDATDLAAMLGGSVYGSQKVASLTNLATSKCPASQIVISGYSEGADIVHRAGPYLSNVISSIMAVVVFGDLLNKQPIQNVPESKVKSFCAFEDISYNQFGIILPTARTSYDDVAPEAANFVMDYKSLSTVPPYDSIGNRCRIPQAVAAPNCYKSSTEITTQLYTLVYGFRILILRFKL